MPSVDQIASADPLILVCPLRDAGEAVHLAGVVKLALERTRGTFVFAYNLHVRDPDAAFLDAFGHPIPSGNTPSQVRGYPPEFHAFFTEYGRSGSAFYESQVERARVLGWINENEGLSAPTALCWETETGGLRYTIPFYLSPSAHPKNLLTALYQAVTTHKSGLAAGMPDYLADVRLGEVETALLEQVGEMEAEVERKREEADALARWRHLIGRASGESFVNLVVAALNVVLDGTGHRAEQRADVGAEDFWIVTPSSDFALAEAKGQGGGITRTNVGQVDSHREQRELPPEFPGLLVVNAFRGDEDLTRKQGERIAPNVLSLAKAQNVVVVRSWDLYQLVGRKLDGENVGDQMISALADAHGGWLRVAEGVEFVR